VPLAHWDFFVEEMETTHSFKSRGHDGPHSLLPRHISWIDVVDLRAWSPFIVNGAMHGSNGEKAEAPGTPHIIPISGTEMPLHFSSTVQLVRC
jgi:hypothetical protein